MDLLTQSSDDLLSFDRRRLADVELLGGCSGHGTFQGNMHDIENVGHLGGLSCVVRLEDEFVRVHAEEAVFDHCVTVSQLHVWVHCLLVGNKYAVEEFVF